MAMMISKFNKMIRNKVFWGIFAFLVSAAFIFTFAPQGSGGGSSSSARKVLAGSMFGRDVSVSEFRQARYFTLNLRSSYIPEEYQQQVTTSTWSRLASLQMADELGFVVGRDEIQERIGTDEAFQENGAYSEQRYRMILGQILKVDEGTFAQYLSENMKLEKLIGTVNKGVWVPGQLLDEQLANFTDTFTLEIATLTREDVDLEVETSDEDVADYFAKNEELFRIDAQRSVDYIAFPYTATVDAASISEDAIQAYYDANPGEMLVLVTNIAPVPPAAGATNVAPALSTNIVEQTGSIDDMRASITSALQTLAVQKAAMSEAEALLNIMLPGDGSTVRFADAAASLKLTIQSTEPFTEAADAAGDAELGPDFVEEAFRLAPDDPQRSFSDTVKGENAVYVLSLREEIPSQIPELDMVRDEVTELATQSKREERFTEAAEATRDAIWAAVKAETSFADAASAQGLQASTTVTFSVASQYYGAEAPSPYMQHVLPEVFDWAAGEVTDPIPSPEGMLIVRIVAREPADLATLNAYRSDIYTEIERRLSQENLQSWDAFILKRATVEQDTAFDG